MGQNVYWRLLDSEHSLFARTMSNRESVTVGFATWYDTDPSIATGFSKLHWLVLLTSYTAFSKPYQLPRPVRLGELPNE